MPKSRYNTKTAQECISCKVSYNVGAYTCQENGCKVANAELRKKYRYPTKPLDPTYTRYVGAKSRANKKNIPFDLTQELIQHIINQPCVYCGEAEGIQLDRKVGADGYTADNVVPACKRCNTVKSMYLTHAEMMIVAKALGWA